MYVRNFLSATRCPHRGQSGRFSLFSPHSRFYENTISENRVLIFSRLPRLDLASDSTPATAVSTFPNSRVVGGRNVCFGKGNVRRVCTSLYCAHTDRILASHFLSALPSCRSESLRTASQIHTLSRHCPSHFRARARALASRFRNEKRSKTKYLRARVCEVLIN